MKARGTFLYGTDLIKPAPAPRFSRTLGKAQISPVVPGSSTTQTLVDSSLEPEKVKALLAGGSVLQSQDE